MVARANNRILIGEQADELRPQIVILEELKALIPPLSTEEREQLEKNISEYGCREALLLWDTTADKIGEEGNERRLVLIDGHNRHSFCDKNEIPFNILLQDFESMEDVREFMIDNQLGRRNLSPEQKKYLLGIMYKSLKQRKGTYERIKPIEESPAESESTDPLMPQAEGDSTADQPEGDPFLKESSVLADDEMQSPKFDNPGASSDWLVQRDNDDILAARFNREANSSRSGSGFGGSGKKGGGKVRHPESEESVMADALEKGKKKAKGKGKKNENAEDNSTAEQLGQQHKVSGKTIRKNEKFADGVERLTPEFKTKVLGGDVKGVNEKLVTLGSLPNAPTNIKDQHELDQVLSGYGVNPDDDKGKSGLSAAVQEMLNKLEGIFKRLKKPAPTINVCEEMTSALEELHQQLFKEQFGGSAAQEGSAPDDDELTETDDSERDNPALTDEDNLEDPDGSGPIDDEEEEQE